MIKNILKKIGLFFLAILILLLLLFAYVNIPVKTPNTAFDLGVTFSWKYSEELGLDWREVYTAMLDDLGVRKVRLPAYWDHIEAE